MSDLSHVTLAARLLAHWPIKLWMGTGLAVVFLASYFAAQQFPLREPILLRPGRIDALVPFDPRWVWAYQSFYALLAFAWLARTRDELARYARGFLLVALVGVVIFVAFPTTVPRPDVIGANVGYRLLIAYDLPLNCFPSQHLSLATYTLCFVATVLGSSDRLILTVLLIWIAAIAYATLATKQHYFIDLPAGVGLGVAGHAFAWRGGRPTRGAERRATVSSGRPT